VLFALSLGTPGAVDFNTGSTRFYFLNLTLLDIVCGALSAQHLEGPWQASHSFLVRLKLAIWCWKGFKLVHGGFWTLCAVTHAVRGQVRFSCEFGVGMALSWCTVLLGPYVVLPMPSAVRCDSPVNLVLEGVEVGARCFWGLMCGYPRRPRSGVIPR
jgi:hypothetical protein